MDAIIAQIEQDILPSLVVKSEDLDAIRGELKGMLAKDHHTLEAEAHIAKTAIPYAVPFPGPS